MRTLPCYGPGDTGDRDAASRTLRTSASAAGPSRCDSPRSSDRIAASRDADTPWAETRIFEAVIRRNIKLAESPSHGKTIFDYQPHSHGAEDYHALAEEFLTHFPPTIAEPVAAEAPAEPAPAAPEPAPTEPAPARSPHLT